MTRAESYRITKYENDRNHTEKELLNMISLHMGNHVLLKAIPLYTNPPTWRDIMHDVIIRSDLHLASLFSDPEINAMIEAREMSLDISGEGLLRQLRLLLVDDDVDRKIVLVDERDSMFDIHDVTLEELLTMPAESDEYIE